MNESTLKILFSSESNDWTTPQDLYDSLNRSFKFTLDPCANKYNTKCENYFTIEDNGLEQSWEGHTVFMNPPYGKAASEWVKKAYDESRKEKTTVVCLLPARTDTKWWHYYVMWADQIYFIKGRLKFGESENSAPFPSAVIVFTAENERRSFLNCVTQVASVDKQVNLCAYTPDHRGRYAKKV